MTDHARGAEPTDAETDATPTGADGPDDRIESRLRAVERAVTGSEARPVDAAADAEATAERERLESRLDDLEERVAELEAATQAVRGYAGAIRAVNREVERRADLALARATEAGRENERSGGSVGRESSASDGQRADDTVPSEGALDAALPDDRSRSGPRTGGSGTDEAAGDGDGGAWATTALDRLRESL
ncbi:DUF7310 family coiled-coil domain-containing protein [Halorubrum ezzemoulense]|uniref:DUF7310 domain-containing protein n=1 Tax=Halorubrum ezzemoulense TaxID=337243 RepID=A0A256JKI4_HALEZ|nr:hypothetical protein [Halorubrum ezzemoulense]OYR69056.1 hypothetical protein DJ78_12065 [Halorubrum ezzemoulense]